MSCGSQSLKLTVACVVLSLVTSVSSTLTPSGSVSIDCGRQQTFTCTVPGLAGWAITGLMGITATGSTAVGVAAASARVTTADTGLGPTSTITITGFNTSDNGGTVQCLDISGIPRVEGMATITVGLPRCGLAGVVIGNDSCPSFTFTPQGSVLPSTVMVSYQLVGDPSSAGSLNCDYPVDPRMCRLVVPGGIYTVRLTPQNSCGSPSSTCPSFTENIRANCTLATRLSIAPAPDPVPICTFSPSGSVSIDCGGQQTFTCTVAANRPAAWIITGLQGIVATGTNGVIVAIINARITTTETTPGATSTITITGFTTADNGGTVQCVDQLGVVEGSATVAIVE